MGAKLVEEDPVQQQQEVDIVGHLLMLHKGDSLPPLVDIIMEVTILEEDQAYHMGEGEEGTS